MLRWGLLGTAQITSVLLKSLRGSARNTAQAIASRDYRRAQSFASEWEIPKVYGSYEALLGDSEIDVVYIPLPNGMHAEWAIKAAKAGKHVLCEKPLSVGVAEVDAMSQAASQAGVVLAEALMYRHHPQTLRVKEVLDSGAIGDVVVVSGSFTIDLSDDPGNIRLNPSLGGGSIWDVGSYPISYARFLVGAAPVEVYGRQVTSATGVDEVFVGQMHFSDGVFAQVDCGFCSPYRTRLDVIGKKGAITIPHPFEPDLHAEISLELKDATQTISVEGQDLYIGEIEDMADAILLGNPTRVSLDESRDNIATIEAFLSSAREGHAVSVAKQT
jgi:predicted dehydrogenase